MLLRPSHGLVASAHSFSRSLVKWDSETTLHRTSHFISSFSRISLLRRCIHIFVDVACAEGGFSISQLLAILPLIKFSHPISA